MKKSQGFTHLALALTVLVVAVIGLIGYKIMSDSSSKQSAHSSNSTLSAPAEQTQTIKSADDLDGAQTMLDNQNVDSDLNPDSLNDDVNSLL